MCAKVISRCGMDIIYEENLKKYAGYKNVYNVFISLLAPDTIYLCGICFYYSLLFFKAPLLRWLDYLYLWKTSNQASFPHFFNRIGLDSFLSKAANGWSGSEAIGVIMRISKKRTICLFFTAKLLWQFCFYKCQTMGFKTTMKIRPRFKLMILIIKYWPFHLGGGKQPISCVKL